MPTDKKAIQREIRQLIKELVGIRHWEFNITLETAKIIQRYEPAIWRNCSYENRRDRISTPKIRHGDRTMFRLIEKRLILLDEKLDRQDRRYADTQSEQKRLASELSNTQSEVKEVKALVETPVSDLLTIAEAALKLNRSKKTVRRLCDSGQMEFMQEKPGIKGSVIYIPSAAIEMYIAKSAARKQQPLPVVAVVKRGGRGKDEIDMFITETLKNIRKGN